MCDPIKLEDENSRNRIVSEPKTNFFVEAGAGSGKTTMLVSRMVAMVESGIPISEICAITYTKAAALEFYERFEKMLRNRSLGIWKKKGKAGELAEPTEETKKLCKDALENIDLCFMGTIDSFCNMIISEHPSEARLPAGTTLLSDDDATNLYRKVFVDISNGQYGTKLKELAEIFATVHWSAEKVFSKCMKIIMDNRNAEFIYDKTFKPYDIDATYATKRTELIDLLKFLIAKPELRYTKKNGFTLEDNKAWTKLFGGFNNIDIKWSSNVNGVIQVLEKFPAGRLLDINDIFNKYPILKGYYVNGGTNQSWLEFKKDTIADLIRELRKYQYEVSMQLFMESIPVVEQKIEAEGSLTFFDYLYYLREMLVNDAEKGGNLIKYIADRHKYYLIDEFQDTNPIQSEIFFYLASDNPKKDWKQCKPRDGALFIVGDPKQSIYRFKFADVASFLKVKEIFKGFGEILYLTQNFRSTPELCKYFNEIFDVLMPADTENQSKYTQIPEPDARVGEITGVYTYKVTSRDDIPNAASDPEQIATIIKKLVNNDKYKITYDDEDKGPRAIKYKDIMIISSGKDHLEPIMKHLISEDIPIKVEGKVDFKDNEALQLIGKLYGAVSDFRNQIALYGALRSKLFNVSNSDILEYTTAGGKISLFSDVIDKDDETIKKVAEAMKKLQNFGTLARTMSPAALMTKLAEDNRIYEVVAAENLEVLYYALELLRAAEQSGEVVSLLDGVKFLDELVSGKAKEERCLSLKTKADCVHIANLHKVKGLEAPVVILAAASKGNPKEPSLRIEHLDDGTKGYLFNVKEKLENTGATYISLKTDEYPDPYQKEAEALIAEQDRLLYVAATRARNLLIIAWNVLKKGNMGETLWAPVIQNTDNDIIEYLNGDEELVSPEKECVKAGDLYDDSAEESVLKNTEREDSTYSVLRPSSYDEKVNSNNSEAESVQEGSLDETFEKHLKSAYEPNVVVMEVSVSSKDSDIVHAHYQEWGTMVHKLMEEVVSSDEKVLVSKASICIKIKEIVAEFWKPQMGDFDSKDKNPYINILTAIANTVKSLDETSEAGRCYRNLVNAKEKSCEVPFFYQEGKVVWNGIIDALYLEDNGNMHVIDYKTNANKTVEELKAEYRNQMTAYIKACTDILGAKEVDATLFHIKEVFAD